MRGPVFVRALALYVSDAASHRVDRYCSDFRFVSCHVDISNVSPIYTISHPAVIRCEIIGFDRFDDIDRLADLHTCLSHVSKKVQCLHEGVECTFYGIEKNIPCPFVQHLMPLYLFATKPKEHEDFSTTDLPCACWYIVHPDERERMERILNGTDNPLCDLVHEPRYNPNISSKLGHGEREEAQEDFEQLKKRKV